MTQEQRIELAKGLAHEMSRQRANVVLADQAWHQIGELLGRVADDGAWAVLAPSTSITADQGYVLLPEAAARAAWLAWDERDDARAQAERERQARAEARAADLARDVANPHLHARAVVTYQSPRGGRIDICTICEDRLAEAWPRDTWGDEYCSVSHGQHDGVCSQASLAVRLSGVAR